MLLKPDELREYLTVLREFGTLSATIEGVGTFTLAHLAQPSAPVPPPMTIDEIVALKDEAISDAKKGDAREAWKAHWARVCASSGSPIPAFPEHLK